MPILGNESVVWLYIKLQQIVGLQIAHVLDNTANRYRKYGDV